MFLASGPRQTLSSSAAQVMEHRSASQFARAETRHQRHVDNLHKKRGAESRKSLESPAERLAVRRERGQRCPDHELFLTPGAPAIVVRGGNMCSCHAARPLSPPADGERVESPSAREGAHCGPRGGDRTTGALGGPASKGARPSVMITGPHARTALPLTTAIFQFTLSMTMADASGIGRKRELTACGGPAGKEDTVCGGQMGDAGVPPWARPACAAAGKAAARRC